jgi:hypothetical protein
MTGQKWMSNLNLIRIFLFLSHFGGSWLQIVQKEASVKKCISLNIKEVNREFDADFKFVEKLAKTFTKVMYKSKLTVNSNKSVKMPRLYFFLVRTFAVAFFNFFNKFEISIQFSIL